MTSYGSANNPTDKRKLVVLWQAHLDPVIAAVSDHDGVIRANSDAPRPRETAGLRAPGADFELHPTLLKIHAPGKSVAAVLAVVPR